MPSMRDFNDMLHQLYKELSVVHDELDQRTDDAVRKEHTYALTKSQAFIDADGSVDAKKAASILATDEIRLESHLADALKNSALERIRTLRSQMTALQTLAHNARVEAELTRLPEEPVAYAIDTPNMSVVKPAVNVITFPGASEGNQYVGLADFTEEDDPW